MQAQTSYMNAGMFTTFKNVVKTDGIIGLYRGIVPPLIGFSIFRSVQFGVYNSVYTHITRKFSWASKPIPYTYGLEYRVPIAIVCASTVRCLVENPAELIKVRQITGQPWKLTGLYSGFSVLWVRSTALLLAFFGLIDYETRLVPELITAPYIGSIIKGGVNGTIAWGLIWPFELVKNQVQVQGLEGPKTLLARLIWLTKKNGFLSLYRGFLPGACRSVVANGVGMTLFDMCQKARKQEVQV